MASDRPVTSGRRRRLSALSPRQELLAVLVLGAVGAGVVFLAMRQSWAQVRTAVPAPLPASVVTVSGQSLLPYAEALAVAALATLAAVLATRRMARRVTGVLLAVLGAGIVAAVVGGVSAAAAVSAAVGNAGTGTGAGSAASSTTDGSSPSASVVPDVAGFHAHAVLTAVTWQTVTIVGAIAVIAAGVLVTWRAERLPVMSSRYDSPTGTGAARPRKARTAAAGAGPEGTHQAGTGATGTGQAVGTVRAGTVRASTGPAGSLADGTGPDGTGPAGTGPDDAAERDSASMWESLSRGEDPTSAGRAG